MIMVTRGVIEVFMMAHTDLGLKRLVTLHLIIWKKMLIVIVDVNIGPRPSTIPPITQVTMLYFGIYLLILIILMIVFMTV